MDLSRLRESFVNILNSLRDRLGNSAFFHFLKEKYDHLSARVKKILQSTGLLIFTSLLLYYPVTRLYSSWSNMRESNTKKKLIQQLVSNKASTNKTLRAKAYTAGQDPARFLQRRVPVLQIPKNQLKGIKNFKEKTAVADSQSLLSFSAQVKKVQMDLKALNLQEIVQYGRKIENLSENIKLTGLKIREIPEQDNYFNVSYILSFFSLKPEGAKDIPPLNKAKRPKTPPPPALPEKPAERKEY